MADLVVENMVVSAELNQSLDLKETNDLFPETTFDQVDHPVLVFHYQNPSRVVLITTQGNIMCTGSKTEEDAVEALHHTVDALKEKNLIKKSTTISPKQESIIVSKNLNFSLPLESIQASLSFDQCIYHPSEKPWLEYHQSQYSMLLFSSGNIICTGNISLDESRDAFKNIENTLTSVGCKIA
jgi:transcription initiation factor TFIID TATA-box-binding protein